MNEIATHKKINTTLCGKAIELKENHSKVELTTSQEMAVDSMGLVHGGFVFGLADYAAMIAVNDPNVVLGSSQVIFKKPVKVGDSLIAVANVSETKNKKRIVKVDVHCDGNHVFEGEFTCFVLDKHVLQQ